MKTTGTATVTKYRGDPDTSVISLRRSNGHEVTLVIAPDLVPKLLDRYGVKHGTGISMESLVGLRAVYTEQGGLLTQLTALDN